MLILVKILLPFPVIRVMNSHGVMWGGALGMREETKPSAEADEEELFRVEALKSFGDRHFGRPIAFQPKLWVTLAFTLVVMVGITAAFITTATYARKERVVGWVMPDEGLIRLAHAQPGQVEAVQVNEGEEITLGQPLITLSFDTTLAEGGQATEQLLVELAVEVEELGRQIELVADQSELRWDQINTSLRTIRREQAHLKEQAKAQDERVNIAKEILTRFENLYAEEAGSFLEVERQREQYTAQRQNLAALEQRLIAMQREREQLQAELDNLPVTTDRTLSELRGRRATLARQKTELERRGRVVLTAPADGRIATLSAEPGSFTTPQLPIATIIPEGSALYAQVFVPSRAIGFVEVGQQVRLMYDPFPHQRYGSAWGIVESVATSVLRPEEIPTAIGLEEPAYKARVKLEREDIEAFGRSFPLKPGMALSAEIIQERRTFLQFILEPLRARS